MIFKRAHMGVMDRCSQPFGHIVYYKTPFCIHTEVQKYTVTESEHISHNLSYSNTKPFANLVHEVVF